MVPSQRWFPQSNAQRAAWFNNFATQFAALMAHLGFVAADVTAVENDNDVVQYGFEEGQNADNYADAVRSYRKQITEGDIGDPTPVWPAAPNILDPPIVPTGIFERLDNLVKRIRVAPNYTNDDGLLLGIVGTASPGQESLENESPTLKAKAVPGNVVQVDFIRGKSDGIAVETQIDNSIDWTSAGSFFKSPAELPIPAGPNNLPRAVRLRARFLDGNKPVGNFSDTVNVVTTP